MFFKTSLTIHVYIYIYIFRVFRKMLFDSRVTKIREPQVKGSKLKALLKRSSEPFMGIQISQQVQPTKTNLA